MYYEDRFKELLITTAKGFGIGLVISVILTALIGAGGVGEFIGVVIAFTIVFGSIVSIYNYLLFRKEQTGISSCIRG